MTAIDSQASASESRTLNGKELQRQSNRKRNKKKAAAATRKSLKSAREEGRGTSCAQETEAQTGEEAGAGAVRRRGWYIVAGFSHLSWGCSSVNMELLAASLINALSCQFKRMTMS
ncbi:hypothetical protein CHARACLAT_012063, partial [Characodon lateralis]|nr:hypothetical protein [Characodon lateralis]